MYPSGSLEVFANTATSFRSPVTVKVLLDLPLEGLRVAVEPLVLGTGRVVDPHLIIPGPQQDVVPTAGPGTGPHQSDSVVTLLQIPLHLVVDGVVRLIVEAGAQQLLAVDPESLELRDEVAVVGALVQCLVAVVHRPFAGIHRGKGLTGKRLNGHSCRRGAASGTADSGALPFYLVGQRFPALVRLEVTDRPLIHPRTAPAALWTSSTAFLTLSASRSEERRVGKEG